MKYIRESRKLVIGFIIGAVMMYSGQVFADSISKVGKKVQAEYTIKVDGNILDAKALAIDGQTTVPARALAEALGRDVSFVNKEVLITKRTEVQSVEEDQVQPETPKPEPIPDPVPSGTPEPEYTLESITALINDKEETIRKIKPLYERMIQDGASPDSMTYIIEQEKELENLKAIKAELESK